MINSQSAAKKNRKYIGWRCSSSSALLRRLHTRLSRWCVFLLSLRAVSASARFSSALSTPLCLYSNYPLFPMQLIDSSETRMLARASHVQRQLFITMQMRSRRRFCGRMVGAVVFKALLHTLREVLIRWVRAEVKSLTSHNLLLLMPLFHLKAGLLQKKVEAVALHLKTVSPERILLSVFARMNSDGVPL